jgi:hypothetical protein|eukprot:SAG25_NODE_114_length_14860_cov_13.403672_6_plen_144_part_00
MLAHPSRATQPTDLQVRSRRLPMHQDPVASFKATDIPDEHGDDDEDEGGGQVNSYRQAQQHISAAVPLTVGRCCCRECSVLSSRVADPKKLHKTLRFGKVKFTMFDTVVEGGTMRSQINCVKNLAPDFASTYLPASHTVSETH